MDLGLFNLAFRGECQVHLTAGLASEHTSLVTYCSTEALHSEFCTDSTKECDSKPIQLYRTSAALDLLGHLIHLDPATHQSFAIPLHHTPHHPPLFKHRPQRTSPAATTAALVLSTAEWTPRAAEGPPLGPSVNVDGGLGRRG